MTNRISPVFIDSSDRRRGFTIVELLIVIIVIAILAAVTVVAYNGVRAKAVESEKALKFATIRKALENYKTLNGSYPGVNQIGGASGAQLLSLTLQNVEPSDANTPGNGIEGGGVSAQDRHIKYMAWDNPDGSGFTCNVAPCGSYQLAYNNRVTGLVVSATNPR